MFQSTPTSVELKSPAKLKPATRQIKLTPRQEKMAAQAAAPKPNKLAFRSLRNGNLEKGLATNYHVTVLNTFMAENPILANGGLNPTKSPVEEKKEPETSLIRANFNEKNVMITATKVYHNITRATKKFNATGKQYTTYSDKEFAPDVYEFIKVLKSKSAVEEAQFWKENWVGIVVDFREEDKSQDGVLQSIDRLGSGFIEHAEKVSIAIYLPLIPLEMKVSAIQSSENYAFLKDLVAKVNELKSIKNLEVILHVPERKVILPHQNLIHFIPFYDFWFVGWKMKWMPPKFRSARTLNRGKAFEYVEEQFMKVKRLKRNESGNKL